MADRKRLKAFDLKGAGRGEVEAVFSTFDVVDADGDITVRDAFEEGAEVLISAYGHGSWRGELPVGKGSIRTTDSDARLHGRLFLDTVGGREAYEVIKGAGHLQEYSFGFTVLADAPPTDEQRQRGARRVLKKLQVHEVSPVFRGAGVGTRTVAIKRQDEVAALVTAARAKMPAVTKTLEAAENLRRRAPSAGHALAAALSVDVARKLLHLDPPPTVVWEPMGGAKGATYIYDRKTIYIDTDVSVAEVPEVVLHEAMHLTQWPLIQSPEAREKEASEFAGKWADTVFRTGWATGWDPGRIRLVDGDGPPRSSAPAASMPPDGTVVLCKGSGEAWLRRSRRPRWTLA